MKSITAKVDLGIDPIAIGAKGMLWKDSEVTIAGIGEAARFPVVRNNGIVGATKAQESLSSITSVSEGGESDHGLVAFAAFPFDPQAPGELIVPRILVRRMSDGELWVTTSSEGALSLTEAVEEVIALSEQQEAPTPTCAEVESLISPERWRDELVTEVIGRIRAGDLEKMVLAREVLISMDVEINVPQVIGNLVSTNPNAMVFSIEGFVGASPELLVSRTGDLVQAHPLAGTAIRLADEEKDRKSKAYLLDSVKDHFEHRITIEWLLNELLPFCSYVDADPEPRVISLPNVHHLATNVHGHLSLPAASVLELVAALHPTPAVAGKPQAEAIDMIAKIEKTGRGMYAGPVGWVDANGNGAFAVGIRSAHIVGREARLFAGVGIVADSDPQSELDETHGKFQTMQSAILSTKP